MAARSGLRGKGLVKILFGLAVFLTLAGEAAAVFPPLYQQPAPPPPTVVTPTADPPVVIVGDPVVSDPGTVVTTPEPATWLSVSLGLLLVAGYAWRKNRQKQSQLICG
jgi:PEP-CTERM motif